MASQSIKILIADHNVTTSKKLATYLEDSGFSVACLHDGLYVPQKILEFRPQFILIDMMLPDFSGFQCLEFLKEQGILEAGNVKVIMLSQHNAKQNVEACLKNGASDYVVKPVNPMDVLTRIALHMQARKRLLQVDEIIDDDIRQTNYYLHLVELVVKAIGVKADDHHVQFQLLRMLSLAVGAVRISLLSLSGPPTVVASSDNEQFKSFQLQIEKYPEIDYVQRTAKPLFIESLKDDVMMAFIKEQMKSVHFNSMIVLPIFENGVLKGILSSRLAETTKLSDADIRLCQIVAQTIGSYWYQLSQRAASKAA
ncbi:MAG: response regulator [Bdellovibrionaceae bacterium]|nr:response regulator [Pseudobdellovibrionaceae bacterium]